MLVYPLYFVKSCHSSILGALYDPHFKAIKWPHSEKKNLNRSNTSHKVKKKSSSVLNLTDILNNLYSVQYTVCFYDKSIIKIFTERHNECSKEYKYVYHLWHILIEYKISCILFQKYFKNTF